MRIARLHPVTVGLCLALGALVSFACDDPPTAPSDPVRLTVIPERQWAGAQVELAVETFAFVEGDVVEIGGEAVDGAPLAADRLRVRLPPTADGIREVRIRRDGRVVATGVAPISCSPPTPRRRPSSGARAWRSSGCSRLTTPDPRRGLEA